MDVEKQPINSVSGIVQSMLESSDGLAISAPALSSAMRLYAEEIKAAHRREVEELRQCLAEAADIACARCNVERGLNCDGRSLPPGRLCLPFKWRKVLEQSNEEK